MTSPKRNEDESTVEVDSLVVIMLRLTFLDVEASLDEFVKECGIECNGEAREPKVYDKITVFLVAGDSPYFRELFPDFYLFIFFFVSLDIRHEQKQKRTQN